GRSCWCRSRYSAISSSAFGVDPANTLVKNQCHNEMSRLTAGASIDKEEAGIALSRQPHFGTYTHIAGRQPPWLRRTNVWRRVTRPTRRLYETALPNGCPTRKGRRVANHHRYLSPAPACSCLRRITEGRPRRHQSLS